MKKFKILLYYYHKKYRRIFYTVEETEIVEVKPTKKRKTATKIKTTKLNLDAEIKFDKVKILLCHGVDTEVMNDVWELIKKYVS